jgi:glutamyl-tRNA reductase
MELYWGEGEASDDIVRHLFRVASGLESSLTGERAIQGQLKTAYAEAIGKYKLSSSLNRLFQTAMHAGKRVRTETGISKGAVSHSQVTVELLKKEKINLTAKKVGIIGVNKLTEDILKFLTDRNAINIFLSNRHVEKAEALAKLYNGTAVPLHEKRKMLAFIDVLISATSAPHSVVEAEDVPEGKEMLIIDLAFPRDVDPSLGDRPGIRLLDLEDIERFAQENLSLRLSAIHDAEAIIEEEIQTFYKWYNYPQ